ncbi:MAG: hypothetical protein ACOX7E_03705 [Paludibacter sp.]|jgi:hypothetical protein
MKRNIHKIILPALFALVVFLFAACNSDPDDKSALITGLWIQEKITEDGVEMPLQDEEKHLSLLIESNGVYRTFGKDAAVKEHTGAWTVTDNTWLELTVDRWQLVNDPLSQAPANQWRKNHIVTRFTILSVTGEVLELRLKTYKADKKYSALFTENARPVITNSNLEEIDAEFKSLKTYIYTFKKSN